MGWGAPLLSGPCPAAGRGRIRRSLERHADLVYETFAPKPNRHFELTQNHDFIPTSGLAVAALALMGESPNAAKCITEGPEEQRGYHLRLETPAAARTTIRVELTVVRPEP